MKIAIIIQKLNFGGAERCASNLSIDLQDKFDTHIIVFDGNNQMYPYGGVLHDLEIPPTSNKVRKVLNVFRRIHKVRVIKKKEKFDCSISLLTGGNYVNVKSSAGEKTIVSIRNNLSLSKLSNREVKMVKESCLVADCVVSLSESVRVDMIRNFGVNPQKIVTIYNSVDAGRLNKMANETHSDNMLGITGDYIVTMGRLMRQKGQWHLIRAFSEVVKTNPDIKLVILGEGEDAFADRIKSLVSKMGLENNVIFLGYIKNPHLIIKNSKLFVFPSLYEGLGNVILEALACGKAVISTDCMSGPREILAPDTNIDITANEELKDIEFGKYGVLVPHFDQNDDIENIDVTENEEILARAICELLSNDKLRHEYERKAQIRVKDFSPTKIASDWANLIIHLCEGKNV